jgi:hypothetical protein
MIRKLSDQEYKQLKNIALPAFQFAINTSFNSAIGCTPFEAEHGVAATSIAQARLQATRYATTAEGGRGGDTLEDVDQFFDQSMIKEQLELAVSMAGVVRTTSEWHRRMSSENLSQSGHVVNLDNYPIGKQAYLYKPPSMAETITRGRRAKHIETVKIAARLDIPHHEGAGGIEDFADKESFQKHVKRVSNRKKRKRK